MHVSLLYMIFTSTRRRCHSQCLTLLVIVPIEDSESWDMECLRTLRGAGAKGLREDGEAGVGEFRVYKGMMLSFCGPPVLSISWLLVVLGEDIGTSTKSETKERNEFPFPNKYNVNHVYVSATINNIWPVATQMPEISDSILTSV